MAEHVARDRAVTAVVVSRLEYEEPGYNVKPIAVPPPVGWLIFITIPSCPPLVNKDYTVIEFEVGRQLIRIRMLLANFR